MSRKVVKNSNASEKQGDRRFEQGNEKFGEIPGWANSSHKKMKTERMENQVGEQRRERSKSGKRIIGKECSCSKTKRANTRSGNDSFNDNTIGISVLGLTKVKDEFVVAELN